MHQLLHVEYRAPPRMRQWVLLLFCPNSHAEVLGFTQLGLEWGLDAWGEPRKVQQEQEGEEEEGVLSW